MGPLLMYLPVRLGPSSAPATITRPLTLPEVARRTYVELLDSIDNRLAMEGSSWMEELGRLSPTPRERYQECYEDAARSLRRLCDSLAREQCETANRRERSTARHHVSPPTSVAATSLDRRGSGSQSSSSAATLLSAAARAVPRAQQPEGDYYKQKVRRVNAPPPLPSPASVSAAASAPPRTVHPPWIDRWQVTSED